MKEKFMRFTQDVQERRPHALVTLGAGVILLVAAGLFAFSLPNKSEAITESGAITSADTSGNGVVAVVGENDIAGTTSLGNSWPAELISSDIVQVQPQRDGTIVDWRVHIGQAVSAGEVLGHISAPPATPDIIKMLADQTQAVTEANAQARVTAEYTTKEQSRFADLDTALDTSSTTGADSFPALASIRAQVAVKLSTLRSVVESALSEQVTMVTNTTDWRYVRFGSFNQQYGSLNLKVQNSYEPSLVSLADALKKDAGVPIEQAQEYFALAVRVANSTPDDSTLNGFKAVAIADQKDFLDAVAEYRDTQMALADKETEYRLMIREKSAMLEKDRSMSASSAEAAQTAYRTVANQVNGGTAIVAKHGGTMSAIYKKVGDLVSPDMSVAVIAGQGKSGLTVRMRIPSTILKPSVGDVLLVVRPGFPKDMRKAKLVGIGSSLDDTGSYMADAILTDSVDWPVSSSVRVLTPKEDGMTVKSSAIVWGDGGVPQVWAVSPGGRIFAKKITIGRTIGSVTEVYSGLANGDKYIAKPTPDIHEDVLLDDVLKTLAPDDGAGQSAKSSGGMGDMPM